MKNEKIFQYPFLIRYAQNQCTDILEWKKFLLMFKAKDSILQFSSHALSKLKKNKAGHKYKKHVFIRLLECALCAVGILPLKAIP